MAIIDTTKGVNGGKKELQCLSADIATLRTDVADGSSCLVVDTGAVLVLHDGVWYEV